CRRRRALSFSIAAACLRNLGGRARLRALRADVSAVHGDLRPQLLDHHHDGLCLRAAAGHPEDRRRPFRHAQGADRCGLQLPADADAAIPENPAAGRAADGLRRRPPRSCFRADQRRRHRIPNQFRRARAAHRGSYRALRSCRHLCRDLLCDFGERAVLHGAGKGGAMAQTGRLSAPAAVRGFGSVTLLRAAIVAATLVIWELLAYSGWLYRDVVPSLSRIVHALADLLTHADYYRYLGVTAGEIGTALAIGGISGLAVGILLGANRFLARAFEPYLYYLGPTPKIIFFPVMIMWFGLGSPSKIALGTLSCFFPVALSVAAGMRQIDNVQIRVGRSFRATTWQMVTKIYLPAMRHPIVNGVRLGFGFALIGVLLAETKLSSAGIGFLIIQAYSVFDMPRMYAMLIVLFVLAIGANALVGRLGGLERIRRS